MKLKKRLSIFSALLLTAGLWGLGFPNGAVAQYVPPVGPSGPVGGGYSGGGGGGGESVIQRWFEERRERREQERREQEREQQRYHEAVEGWNQFVREFEADYRAQQELDARVQQESLSRARRNARVMNAWNDLGVEAYRAGHLGNAVTYFKAAQQHSPDSPDIRHNLRRAESKLSAEAQSYLSSLDTALGIASLSPHLLIFHPDPNIRAEANRQLARETMEKIAEAATTFVAEERLNGGKVEPFPWETEAERAARRQEAMDHARKVESLRREAYSEARSLAEAVVVSDATADIRIEPKPATRQLLKICISGFE